MLLHAYLYYTEDDNIWEDHVWDKQSRALLELQKEHGWNIGFYDEIFRHWTGQSGYWLPTNDGRDDNVVRVAKRTLAFDKKLAVTEGAVHTPYGWVAPLLDLQAGRE